MVREHALVKCDLCLVGSCTTYQSVSRCMLRIFFFLENKIVV